MKKWVVAKSVTGMLLGCLLLGGCGAAGVDSASQSASGSGPGSTASMSIPVSSSSVPKPPAPSSRSQESSLAPSPVPSSSSAPPSSSSKPEVKLWYEETAEVPPGPYEPATEEEMTDPKDQHWFHFLNPEGIELPGYINPQPILDYRFEQWEGTIHIGYGIFGTDGGVSYHGNYSYLGEGIFLANMDTVWKEAEGRTEYLVSLTFRVEWPQDRRDIAVITILSIEDAQGEFTASFGEYINVPLAFIEDFDKFR